MKTILFITLFLSVFACKTQGDNISNNNSDKVNERKSELIIVFKKTTSSELAKKILDDSKVKYRTGMDSSKGKGYFYKTGDKFILTFKTNKEKKEFLSKYEKKDEIYEIYTPSWNIRKD